MTPTSRPAIRRLPQSHKRQGARGRLLPGLALLVATPWAMAQQPPAADQGPIYEDNDLGQVVIRARDARYVAPTTRDGIGRIWAPVMIDGKGPFRLALDTGANGNAITPSVVIALGANPNARPPVRLRGISGSMTVPAVVVDSLSIGDLWLHSQVMPVLPDAMGGAEGVLGGASLDGMRVYISFRYDRIEIRRGDDQPPEKGMTVIPFRYTEGHAPVVDAIVAGIPIKAVINTGGQNTIGNARLQAMMTRGRRGALVTPSADRVTDITKATTDAVGQSGATLVLGSLTVRYPHVSFADFGIFKAWGLEKTPALVIGMDTLGLFDTVIIDYSRQELQLRLKH